VRIIEVTVSVAYVRVLLQILNDISGFINDLFWLLMALHLQAFLSICR